MIRLALRRMFRRLRHLPRDLGWDYESCDRCGRAIRTMWWTDDTTWQETVGSEGGCMCVDCFVGAAEDKGLSPSFTFVKPFSPSARGRRRTP
jgi:hypothetical protein